MTCFIVVSKFLQNYNHMSKRKSAGGRAASAKRGKRGAGPSGFAVASRGEHGATFSQPYSASCTSWLEVDALDLERLAKHPFVGTWFPLKVHHLKKTASGDTQNVRLDHPATLVVTLLADNGKREVAAVAAQDDAESGSRALEVRLRDSGNPDTMEVRINTLSCYHKGKEFTLHVAAAPSDASKSSKAKAKKIKPTQTESFRVVKQRIRVTRTGAELDTFFKDEGGKDKYFDLKVELMSASGVENLRGEDIPITVTAHYNNEGLTPAPKMTTSKTPIPLLVCADGVDFKIGTNGCGLVRCRINDVSKNHEKSGFRIRISAGQGIVGVSCQ